MNIWSVLRILFWGLFLIVPTFGIEGLDMPCRSFYFEVAIFSIAAFIVPIVSCLFESIIFSLTIEKKELWKRPSLHLNPFKGEKPLQFFWFISIGFILAGVGSILGFLWIENQPVIESFVYLFTGLSGFLGVKVAVYFFRSRFEEVINVDTATEPNA